MTEGSVSEVSLCDGLCDGFSSSNLGLRQCGVCTTLHVVLLITCSKNYLVPM